MWFNEDIEIIVESDVFVNVSGINEFSKIDVVEVDTNEDIIIVQTSDSIAPVQSVNGKIGFVNIDKTDIGLSNVENISIINTSGYLQDQIDNVSGSLNPIYVTKLNGEFLNPPTIQGTGFILNEGHQTINGSLEVTGKITKNDINVSVVPTSQEIDFDTGGWQYVIIDGYFELTLQLTAQRNIIYSFPTSWESPQTRHIRLPKENNLAGDSIVFNTNYLPPSSRINFYQFDPGPGWVLIDSWGNSSFEGLYRPFTLSLITYFDSVISTPWQRLPNKWNATPPQSINSPGVPGDLSFDGTHIYVCVGNNEWRRVTASTWD